jgi:hypothetical protein
MKLRLCFLQIIITWCIVLSKKSSQLGTCPYPQFELLQNSHTPVANECASKLKIEVGPCKGATVYIKALGMYTTVVDLQFAEGGDYSHCVGEDLVTTALLNRTVKVPMKYFGVTSTNGDVCLEFPATVELEKRESMSRYTAHRKDSFGACDTAGFFFFFFLYHHVINSSNSGQL